MNNEKIFQLNFYRHYKNKPYQYVGVVKHSETLEELVYYKCRYENDHGKLWVRPKGMFHEKVKIENEWKDRFEKINFTLLTFEKLEPLTKEKLKVIYQEVFGNVLNDEKWNRHQPEMKNMVLWAAFESKNPEKWVAFKLGYRQVKDQFYSWLGGVSRDYQGLGLSQHLTNEMIQYCKNSSIKKIATKALNTNNPQILSNLKSGLRIVATEESKRGVKLIFELDI